MIDEPLFNTLRTNEQLGYHVQSTIHNTHGILGYAIEVNSQADKFSTKVIDDKIENFLLDTHNNIANMSQETFEAYKAELLKLKEVNVDDLPEEVSRFWKEITDREYAFDRVKKEMEIIPKVTFEEFKQLWNGHNVFCNSNTLVNFRKLSVQVIGHTSGLHRTDASCRTYCDSKCLRNSVKCRRKELKIKSKDSCFSHYASVSCKDTFCDYNLMLLGPDKKGNCNESKEYFITDLVKFKGCLKFYASKNSKT